MIQLGLTGESSWRISAHLYNKKSLNYSWMRPGFWSNWSINTIGFLSDLWWCKIEPRHFRCLPPIRHQISSVQLELKHEPPLSEDTLEYLVDRFPLHLLIFLSQCSQTSDLLTYFSKIRLEVSIVDPNSPHRRAKKKNNNNEILMILER